MSEPAREDTAAIVLANYEAWKGEARRVLRLDEAAPHVSAHFAVLEYGDAGEYNVYCTVGASYTIIPHSPTSFRNERGVRFEYLMHALPRYAEAASDMLLTASVYPFLTNTEYRPGFVVPIGGDQRIVEESDMAYLYFTYPYLDDPKIFDPPCMGEIDLPDMLIQTLWVFPIYRAEAEFIQREGVDAFEQRFEEQDAQPHDFFRPSVA